MTVARARIGVRQARRALAQYRAGAAPRELPPIAGVRFTPCTPDQTKRAALASGIRASAAAAAVRSGALTAYQVSIGSDSSTYLCRYDGGTATTEVYPASGPRGPVDHRAVAALARALVAAGPDLRRVAISLPPAAPSGPALVGLGFLDEGWSAPPAGGLIGADGGDWHMYTLLAH